MGGEEGRGGGYTSVWDEADFQEWSDHGWDIASLEVAQSSPFGYHQSVHGNPHISIAREREIERKRVRTGWTGSVTCLESGFS